MLASIQKKLLSTKSLTFAEACDMVKTAEAAENNSKLIQSTDFPSKSVNYSGVGMKKILGGPDWRTHT